MTDKSLRVTDYLEHVLAAIDRINRYTAGIDFNSFVASDARQALQRPQSRRCRGLPHQRGCQADPMIKGHVFDAVEVTGRKRSAEELGIVARARPEDFREDGRFRWPTA